MKEKIQLNTEWQGDDKGGFSIQRWVGMVLSYWPLFLGCVLVSLLIAFLYLRYTTPQYNVYSRILVKDEKAASMGEAAVLEEVLEPNAGKSSVENEVEIIKSYPLMRKVVEDLQLNVRVFTTGRFKELEFIPCKTI